jgi:cell division protein ZapA
MSEGAVQLKLAGQTYQVVSSAREPELKRLAQVVEQTIFGLTPPGRQPSPQALVLAAITLAHELEEAQTQLAELRQRHKQVLSSLLGRVDSLLEASEGMLGEEAPAPARSARATSSIPSEPRVE